jgi:uncharacterized protein (TIGR02266 family)
MTKTERRGDPRIPLQMWVEEIRPGERYFEHAANLSRGGLYLDHTIPHAQGTIVLLKFVLPGDKEAIVVHGEVVSPPDVKRPGMHIRFVGLDAEDESRIARLLGRAARSRKRKERASPEPARSSL